MRVPRAMKYGILLLFCLVAFQCSAQQSRKDSLRRDSLVRVGFRQCEAVLKMHFDTCIRTYDSLCGSACQDWVCVDTVTHDSVVGWGVYRGCCSNTYECVYKNGKLIGRITKAQGRDGHNEARYYIAGEIITVTWKNTYALEELRIIPGVDLIPVLQMEPASTAPVRVK